MRVGGFDAVVGNPPYVRMEVFKEIKDYLRTHYRCHDERTDLYVNFIEREHDLLRPNGRLGMIVSNKFIRANYGEPVRRHLESCATIERILDLAGLPVFRGATVRTVILIIHKGRSQGRRPAVIYSPPPPVEDLAEVEEGTRTLAEIADPLSYRLRAADVRPGGWRLLRQDASKLMDRLSRRGAPLGEFTNGRICRGIVSGLNEAFVIDNQTRRSILAKNPAAKAIIRPFLQGRQIRRYEIEAANEFLIYTHHGVDMKPYPAVLEHLRPFRKQLQNRATRQE